MLEGLNDFLNDFKIDLQNLYENLDDEVRKTDNQLLIDDSYHSVLSKLENALNEMDTLIGDLNNGIYDGYDNNDDTSEVNN